MCASQACVCGAMPAENFNGVASVVAPPTSNDSAANSVCMEKLTVIGLYACVYQTDVHSQYMLLNTSHPEARWPD